MRSEPGHHALVRRVLDGYQDHEFYMLPVKWIRKHHTQAQSGRDKVHTKGQRIDQFKNDKGFEQIASDLGNP